MQGIVGGAFEGAGVAIGSLVGGAVYKSKVSFSLANQDNFDPDPVLKFLDPDPA